MGVSFVGALEQSLPVDGRPPPPPMKARSRPARPLPKQLPKQEAAVMVLGEQRWWPTIMPFLSRR